LRHFHFGIAEIAVESLVGARHGQVRRLDDILAGLGLPIGGSLIVFPIAAPIFFLLEERRWSTIMALGAWSPPKAWLEGRPVQTHTGRSLRNVNLEGVRLDDRLLDSWIRKLRGWAPRILAGGGGSTFSSATAGESDDLLDDGTTERYELIEMLAGMQQLKHEITVAPMVRRGVKHYTSEYLLQCISFACGSRQRGGEAMQMLLERSTCMLVPSGIARDGLLHRLRTMPHPSKSSINRYTLMVDTAMMIDYRSFAAKAAEYLIFWMADSSPQAGADYLLIRSEAVRIDGIVAFFRVRAKLIDQFIDDSPAIAPDLLEQFEAIVSHVLVKVQRSFGMKSRFVVYQIVFVRRRVSVNGFVCWIMLCYHPGPSRS